MEEVRQQRIRHKQSMKQKELSTQQKATHGDDDDGVTWGFSEYYFSTMY